MISAMRSAARQAVNAAKKELKIKSPSQVFRDEVGVMTMRGFGAGVLKESKAQARVIRNASRFLTGEAREGAIVQSSSDNRRTYYAQFRVDRDYNWISCRSCNVIESVPPSENEIVTLLYMPVIAMDDYGDGIASICTLGADPYQAFASCQAIIDED